ncbi:MULTISPECIES: type II toxin-antitoxin system PemK/MazF family toxin [Enterococcus]|nr:MULTISPECIES: type II toxin-antitoxin system PemK/MazF family toxin [Enterococcus]MDT2953164.1 type II toxin-antitoxin system PemK/MazF family toxin [Enterococcus casseliflavus]MDT2956371.1 type II toxin-antitoxin system PemK/MazF family toxin [Enterococcus casseliflavus]MDT2972124.1 type II toxin-antitoxin system PemK/MazF family toxin [Enterococcus casseliflavus]MDT2988901.1 type II toxin-antitoxin system PemK/MazF family toxin [Enterococcus casseliflavus]MDV7688291.1 type II toxin-antito
MVSNDYYNKSFNTILVMPISSSKKYVEEKFARSNAFQTVTETQ